MRNVWILALANAFAACGTIMLVSFGGIVGVHIAPRPALATLPLSLSILGVAVSSLPAALLMQRIGRKPAFIGSALVGTGAALLCAWSVASENFPSLCLAGFLLGCNMSFALQYRFAATEYVAPEQAGRAVATVMLGTLVAAIMGPQLGVLAKDLGGWREYSGSYVALAGLYVIATMILATLDGAPRAMQLAREATARPLVQIAAQRAFRLAVLAGVVSYAVMSFIMTATPISMHSIDGHSGSDTSLVISGHLLGMYLPSLATGWLINALGIRRLMIAGAVAMLACVAISVVLGHGFLHYFAGLMLLGVGWNFLFVGGTTLLTTTYAPAERFRAQGFNDLAVFGSQTVASLLAGAAIQTLGWQRLNLVTLPLIAIMMFAVFALRRV